VNIESMSRRDREAYLRSLPVEERVDAVFAYENRPLRVRPYQVAVIEWDVDGKQNRRRTLNDRCQFPECVRPARKRSDRGHDSLCHAHARQWSRHKRLVAISAPVPPSRKRGTPISQPATDRGRTTSRCNP
jgi:hypothetical protein